MFDETGAPVTANELLIAADGTCTVTETDAGGAVSTSYACDTAPDAAASPCDPNGRQVTFASETRPHATVTITNVFPAAVQVIAPRFTG